MFASGMSQLGRARLFGSRTAGSVAVSTVARLANGDSFQCVVADFTTVKGRSLEGAGVLPDVEIPLSRKDLLEKRDSALEAAVKWIVAGEESRGHGESAPRKFKGDGSLFQGGLLERGKRGMTDIDLFASLGSPVR